MTSGRAYQVSPTSDVPLFSKGFIRLQAGNTYRMIAMVRQTVAPSDNSKNHFIVDIWGLDSNYAPTPVTAISAAVPGYALQDTEVGVADGWVTLAVDLTIGETNTAVWGRSHLQIFEKDGSTIQVLRLSINNITGANLVKGLADAAALSASNASASETAAGGYASSSLTNSTNAHTEAQNALGASQAAQGFAADAHTYSTQSGTSASDSAGSASAAQQSAISSATSVFQSAVVATGNIVRKPEFSDQQYTGWSSLVSPTIQDNQMLTPLGYRYYLQTEGRNSFVYKPDGSEGLLRRDWSGRKLQVRIECNTKNSDYAMSAGVWAGDASGALLGYSSIVFKPAREDTWTVLEGVITLPQGARAINPWVLVDDLQPAATSADMVEARWTYFEITDVTELLAAQSAASAANISEQNASSYVTSTQGYASAAQASASQAQTAQGLAESARSQADTSFSNAQGSATSAHLSEQAAATSASAATLAAASVSVHSDRLSPGQPWQNRVDGVPDTSNILTSDYYTNTGDYGWVWDNQSHGTGFVSLSPLEVIRNEPDRIYEIEVSVRGLTPVTNSSATNIVALDFGILDSNFYITASSAIQVVGYLQGIQSTQSFPWTVLKARLMTNSQPSAQYFRPRFYANYDPSTSNSTNDQRVQVQYFRITDISEQYKAEQAASAAAGSSSSASTSKSGADESAAAALQSETNAHTYAGDAQTFAGQASHSEQNAAGSASTASIQASVASSANSQSIKLITDQHPTTFEQEGLFFAGDAGNPVPSGDFGPLYGVTCFINPSNTYGVVSWKTGIPFKPGFYKVKAKVGNYQGTSSGVQLRLGVYGDPSCSGGRIDIWLSSDQQVPTDGFMWVEATVDLSQSQYQNPTYANYGIRPEIVAWYGQYQSSFTLVRVAALELHDVTSEQLAQGFASSASTSASSSQTSADASGQSARAANSDATTAATKAGEALTSSQNAAMSESNALGYSNSASQSSTTSAESRDAAIQSALATYPTTFDQKDLYFGGDQGSPIPTGIVWELVNGVWSGHNSLINSYGILSWKTCVIFSPGKWRVRAKVGNVSGSPSSVELRVASYPQQVTTSYSLINVLGTSDLPTPADGFIWVEAIFDLSAVDVSSNPWIKPEIVLNWPNPSNNLTYVYIQALEFTDVTLEQLTAGYASAAAISASNAQTASTNSGTFASAADQSRVDAQTARGDAQTYASNAALSYTNANSSYINAQSAAGVSVQARDAAIGAASVDMPSTFDNGFVFWSSNWQGSLSNRPVLSSYWSIGSASDGPYARMTGFTGDPVIIDIANFGVVRLVHGRRHRMTVRWKVANSNGKNSVNATFFSVGLGADYNGTSGHESTEVTISSGQPGWGVNSDWSETSLEYFDSDFISTYNAVFTRLLFRYHSDNIAEDIYVQSLRLEDITDEYLSSTNASAAAISASNASASENNAGQSATAANLSKIDAQTARGDAQTYAGNAALSKSDADAASSNASTQAGIAVTASTAAIKAVAVTMPSDFTQGGIFWRDDWFLGASGNAVGKTYGSDGTRLICSMAAGQKENICPQTTFPNITDRTFRMTITGYLVGGGNGTVVLDFITFDDNDQNGTNATGEQSKAILPGISAYSLDYKCYGSQAYFRPRFSYNGDGGGAFNVITFECKDVTAEVEAGKSASAAALSASSALANASDAGQSATAANLSKIDAQTARGDAQTYAGNAAQSKSDADAAYTNASTQAGIATSASQIAVAAAQIALPSDFSGQDLYWNIGDSSNATSYWETHNGEIWWTGSVNSGGHAVCQSKGSLQAISAHTYRVTVEVKNWSDGSAVDVSAGIAIQLTNGSIVALDNRQQVTAPNGGFYSLVGEFTADTTWVKIFPRAVDWNGSFFVRSIKITDITGEKTSSGYASAAAASASTADSRATDSGNYASQASTSEGNAQTYQNNAYVYSQNAQGSANNASISATSASSYATLSSSFSAQALTRNPYFADPTWTAQDFSVPPGWNLWAAENNAYYGRRGDLTNNYPGGKVLEFDRQNGQSGFVQSISGIPAGYYVIEVDISIQNGSWAGVGLYCEFNNGSFYIENFGIVPDTNSVTGNTYPNDGSIQNRKFSILVQNATYSNTTALYGMAGWGNLGSTGSVITLWHKFLLRPATQGEIEGHQAKINSDANTASISTLSSTTSSSISAAAYRVSTLEATVGASSGALNNNPSFSIWPDNQALPSGWSYWQQNNATVTRVSDGRPSSSWCVNYVSNDNSESGFFQPVNVLALAGWYVWEVDVDLNSGSWVGSGVTIHGNYNWSFASEPDDNGISSDSQTGNRKWSRIFQKPADSSVNLHAMVNWQSFGGVAKTLVWHKFIIRPASQAEIQANQVFQGNAGPLVARVSTSEGAITSLNGKTSAYWVTGVTSGTGRAQLSIHADSNGGGGVDITGDVSISGDLLVGGTVSTIKIADAAVNTGKISDNAVTKSLVFSTSTVFTGDGYTPNTAGSGSTTPPSGGTDPGTGDGDYGDCVAADSWLPDGVQAIDKKQGDLLYLLNADDSGFYIGDIERVRDGYEPCVRITVESGATLVCSTTTPITSRKGEVFDIWSSLGVEVPTLEFGTFCWQKITSIISVGTRTVCRISARNGTYAAGEILGRYIFTHNVQFKG